MTTSLMDRVAMTIWMSRREMIPLFFLEVSELVVLLGSPSLKEA
jgi:hypothetical protein